ncbi:uncharacterized protein [Cicer arietinum]|uniref:uncharacterized protein n=1 Tax=Cicer arietinum TaxID=3827 RepID=UPI00032AD20F
MVNVIADENCGYRDIAALFGHNEEYWSIARQQLYTEIKSKSDLYVALFKERLQEMTHSLLVTDLGNQPNEKWMGIPYMNYVIATKYNLTLVPLEKTLCLTFFPLRGAHNGDLSCDRIISIGFVNKSHWVQVKLK